MALGLGNGLPHFLIIFCWCIPKDRKYFTEPLFLYDFTFLSFWGCYILIHSSIFLSSWQPHLCSDAGSLRVRWCSAICSGGGPYVTCVFFQVPNECLQSVTSWHSRKKGLNMNMCPKILATVYGGFLKILAQSLMGTLWWTNILPWKDPPFFMGKSTISTGHFPLLFVCSPEGRNSSFRFLVSVVGFSTFTRYGFHKVWIWALWLIGRKNRGSYQIIQVIRLF